MEHRVRQKIAEVKQHHSVIHLWNVEKGRTMFGAAMARNRFQVIKKHDLNVLIPRTQDWNANNETRWGQSETFMTSLLQDAERLIKQALGSVSMSS